MKSFARAAAFILAAGATALPAMARTIVLTPATPAAYATAKRVIEGPYAISADGAIIGTVIGERRAKGIQTMAVRADFGVPLHNQRVFEVPRAEVVTAQGQYILPLSTRQIVAVLDAKARR